VHGIEDKFFVSLVNKISGEVVLFSNRLPEEG